MAEQYLNVLLGDRATLVPLTNNAYPITSVYELNRSAMVMAGKEVFGVIGEFNEATKKALKLPDYTAGFELDIELYNKFIGDRARKYSPLSVFPKTQQDITFKVKAGLPLPRTSSTCLGRTAKTISRARLYPSFYLSRYLPSRR